MRRLDSFQVRQLTLPASPEPQVRLIQAARDTGLDLQGVILEAALEVTQSYLFFLTYDCPYEEALEIYLVSPRFHVIDRATIAAPYAPGIFQHLTITSPTEVEFQFLGDHRWRLTLLPAPQLSLPWFSDPPAVTRPFSLTRRFHLTRLP